MTVLRSAAGRMRLVLLCALCASAGRLDRYAARCEDRAGLGDAAPVAGASIADFFKPGMVLLDTNGDGVIDFVNARLVLPEHPAATEIAAAAGIAARLGFETSAMNLPLPRGNGGDQPVGPAVFIGAGSLERDASIAGAGHADRLKAGEGVILALGTPAAPSLAVLGGDDNGLTAAAIGLAGHLPLIWDQKGPTLAAIADDVTRYLEDHRVGTSSAAVSAVYVQHGIDPIERVVVDVIVTTAGAVVKAQAALNQLRAAARPTPPTSGRALSYPSVRSLRIRVHGAQHDRHGPPAGPGRVGAAAVAAPAASAMPGSLIVIDLPRSMGPERGDHPGNPRTVMEEPAAVSPSGPRAGVSKVNFDLSNFYSNEGALGDSDNNLIPDRVDVMLCPYGEGTEGVVDLAARLGLESTGIQVPIAKTVDAITTPGGESILVLAGVSHPLAEGLIRNKKWQKPVLGPGEGLIALIRKAYGEKSALIVTGGDAAGVDRALAQLAERFPHIWSRGKDRTTLDDVGNDVRTFLAGRSPAGQAAMSLYKLDWLAGELRDKTLASAHVKVFVEKAADGLADVIRKEAAARIRAASVAVDVQTLDVQKGRPLIDEAFDIASEVDEFWAKLRANVIPAVSVARKQKGRAAHPAVTVEARLSEPPEVRRRIEQQARAELVAAGADDGATTVTVLSAYKQGYSWLYDVVRPALAGKPIDRITIRFAEIGPASGWKQEGMYAPTRWLLEIYPIDEILAQELRIDPSRVRFEKRPIGAAAYEVIATSPGGIEIFHQTFEPATVERVFFDRFPDYEHVRVTTGWIKADVAGRVVVDGRIETDPERFWDHYQGKTLPALYDHVMALEKGKPRPEDAPFFGELKVDLSMSEPDYRLPVDQEQISSMEALHEEIYFNTLHFFDVMGRFTRGAALTYPGRIIPIMHPRADGKPGHARISLTGFDAPRPMVVVEYVEVNGDKGEVRLDIPKITVERPQTIGAWVRSGRDGLERLDLRVKVDSQKDERRELVKQRAEEQVDRQIISAEQVQAVFANLSRLRAAGLYRDALAYHDLGTLRVTAAWEYDSTPETEVVSTLDSNGSPGPFPDIKTWLPRARTGGSMEPTGESIEPSNLVQWDTPIPPGEAYGVLARMSAFKEATVYKIGHSYLGQDIWAMDLMPPMTASHWSQAKQTTLKPTVVYSARQHANEVSSTSHTLKLAELLLTDPVYREKLKKVNIVFHPITNPDGAQLAYDLQKITPNFMLHAGYLGALGVDVTTGQWDPDPIYPESGIRPKIWRTWLPDIFLNPHGYPSHEWVQLFSEYAAWVRTRAVETRDYWTMRGWWMPGFAWLDDPRYPRHKAEQMKLLHTITEFVKAAPAIVALNQRAYERYKRYGFDFDQKNFKLDFTDGVLIYKALKGTRVGPQGAGAQSPDAQGPGAQPASFMARQPNVTIWEGGTEAPDETARGDWLKLVAGAGLQWDKAVLEYLVQGRHEVERKVEPFRGGASLRLDRPRPPKPAREEGKTISPTRPTGPSDLPDPFDPLDLPDLPDL